MEPGRPKAKKTVIVMAVAGLLFGALTWKGGPGPLGPTDSNPVVKRNSRRVNHVLAIAAVQDTIVPARSSVSETNAPSAVQDTLAPNLLPRTDSGEKQTIGSDTSAAVGLPKSSEKDSILTAAVPMECPVMENRAFGIGENLVFDIAFGPVKAGTATMAVVDTQIIAGRPCFHIVTTAESSPFFSTFYRVRDRVELRMDIATLLPWTFEKHIREGRYRADVSVVYDQISHRVIRGKDTLDVSPCINDVLSSFYYVRTVPLAVGKPMDIDNYGDGKIYPLRILVQRKERVKVPAGKFDCIVVEPVMRVEGIFNQKGRMTIWMTDDVRRIPVLMKSKILVGSIEARLRKIDPAALD